MPLGVSVAEAAGADGVEFGGLSAAGGGAGWVSRYTAARAPRVAVALRPPCSRTSSPRRCSRARCRATVRRPTPALAASHSHVGRVTKSAVARAYSARATASTFARPREDRPVPGCAATSSSHSRPRRAGMMLAWTGEAGTVGLTSIAREGARGWAVHPEAAKPHGVNSWDIGTAGRLAPARFLMCYAITPPHSARRPGGAHGGAQRQRRSSGDVARRRGAREGRRRPAGRAGSWPFARCGSGVLARPS